MASNRTEKKLIAEYKRLQKAGYSALRVTVLTENFVWHRHGFRCGVEGLFNARA